MSNTTFIALVGVAIELITSSTNYYFNSPWAAVVKTYAPELLDKFEESHGATEHPTMETLLDGAAGWLKYSEGGCALIFEADLRERFRDTAYAACHDEGCAYLEAQASALSNAAYLILDAVIKAEQNPQYYIGRIILDMLYELADSKLCFLSRTGKIVTRGEFIQRNGVVYSNYSFTDEYLIEYRKPKTPTVTFNFPYKLKETWDFRDTWDITDDTYEDEEGLCIVSFSPQN